MKRLCSLTLLLSLAMGLLLPASAAQDGIPIRVNRPDARIGSFEVWAEECDESGSPTGSARYLSSSAPAPGAAMDYFIPVSFPTHRQDYLIHVKSVPDERYKGFFTGSEKTMVWTYHFITGLTLNPAFLSLRLEETQTITATIEPEGAAASLTWNSSDEAVATVDQSGRVTGISEGTAIITATAKGSGVNASCEVRVIPYEPPTEEATCGHTGGFHGGSGTETDPYRIYTTEEFLHHASHNSNCYFKQMVDLDFSGTTLTTHVSQLSNSTYDGNYHVIRNLTIENATTAGRGVIFLTLYNCTIQRLGIENAVMDINYGSPAILAGTVKGSTVRECYSLDCTIHQKSRSTGNTASGLVDQLSDGSTLERCYTLGFAVDSSYSLSSTSRAAGLVTTLSSPMTDCYSIPYSLSSNYKIRSAMVSEASNSIFAGPNYYYPLDGLPGHGSGSPPGLDLLISLNPISEFSNPDNFAFSSGDWVWRTLKFRGAEDGLSVPTLRGFAHQS